MGFDTAAARKAGYTDAEIADYLAPRSGFDAAAARKAGYEDAEILDYLAKVPEAVKSESDLSSGSLLNSMVRQNEAAAIESGVDRSTTKPRAETWTDLKSDTGSVKSGLPNMESLSVPGAGAKSNPNKIEKSGSSDFDMASETSDNKDRGDYLGRSFASGAVSVLGAGAKLFADAYNTFFGLSREDAQILGVEQPRTPGKFAEDAAREVQAKSTKIMEGVSEGAKRKYQALEYATMDPEKSAFLSPTRIMGDILQSLPSTAAMAISARFGGKSTSTAYERELASGATKEEAKKVAVQEAMKVITRAGATSEGALGYSQTALAVEERVNNLDQKEISKSPEYQALIEQGKTPETAQQIVASRAGTLAGFLAGTVDTVTNLASGPILGKIIGEGGSLLPRTAKGFGTEASQEMTQGAGETVGENYAEQRFVDPSKKLSEGVGEAMLQGAAVGGLTGGAATAAFGAGPGGDNKGPIGNPPDDGVDAYIENRDRQLAGEPTDAFPIAKSIINGGQSAIVIDGTEIPAAQAPQAPVSDIFNAEGIDGAIVAAAETAVSSPTGTPRTSLDQMIDENKQALDADLPSQQAIKQEKLDALRTTLNGTTAWTAWEPDPANPDAGSITAESAAAQREHWAKYGKDIVFVADNKGVPFDGVVDDSQPDTVFLSSNTTRNAEQLIAHEIGHTMENTKLPGAKGESLNTILSGLIEEGIVGGSVVDAMGLHSQTAPARENFPNTPEGVKQHHAAVMKHLYNELGKDMMGDAPRFPGFVEKVISAVETRYGSNTALDVLGKLVQSLRNSFDSMKKFFSVDPRFDTSKWVNNLDKIHDTIAQMHAAKLGEVNGLKDVAPATTPEQVIKIAEEVTPPPTRAGPAPREGYAEAKEDVAMYTRWLRELDTKRRADADKSPEVAALRAKEKEILGKVRGGEKYLSKTAQVRLANIRADIDARVNPKEDDGQMQRVRGDLQRAKQRMADATSVSKEKIAETPKTKPASGEPVRIGKPAPRAEETGNPAEGDRFTANQMAQDTGGSPSFSPKQRETAFKELADAQRDVPENAMVKAQTALRAINKPGTATLGHLLEHVGDLTHRMSEIPRYQPGLAKENVPQKVRTALGALNSYADRYDMEDHVPRDMRELKEYADAHAALPAHNEMQRAARDAAVALGNKDFTKAKAELAKIKAAIDDGTFGDKVMEYSGAKFSPKAVQPLKVTIKAKPKEDTTKPKAAIDAVYKLRGVFPHPFARDHFTMNIGDNEHIAMVKLSVENENMISLDWISSAPQGEGIGRKAIKRIQEVAAENNVGIHLYTSDRSDVPRSKLVKIYKSVGFEQLGKTPSMEWKPPGAKFSPKAVEPREPTPPKIDRPEFKKWFGDSEVVNADGSPRVMYHGTESDVESFFPGSHFGTRAAAKQRLAERMGWDEAARDGDAANILLVYLRIENPLRVTDAEASDEATLLSSIIKGKYPDLDVNTARRKGAMRAAKDAGYDGFVYNNRMEDRGRKSYVAFEPTQIKSAIGNNGNFDPNDPRIQYSPKVEEKGPVFFSALERAVDGMKMDKAPPGQWLGQIRNTTGVKAEEIKTTGIEKWLNQQTGPVTKAEVIEQLQLNAVQVEEVNKGFPSNQAPKFGTYVLPGGKNYRELLVILPERADTKKITSGNDIRSKVDQYVALGFSPDAVNAAADFVDEAARLAPGANAAAGLTMQDRLISRGFGYTAAQKEAGQVLRSLVEGEKQRAQTNTFKSTHWDEKNVLAHIRFDERIGPNGERILHIAEIQSDWHQIGRRDGYADPGRVDVLVEASRKATDDMYALRDKMILEATDGKYASKREAIDAADMAAYRAIDAVDAQPEMLAAVDLHNKAVEELNRARNGVPDAPFKTTWHELAFKRALRYAVENGFDQVTWDTGDTNNERYDLSKQVDGIGAKLRKDGQYDITVYEKDGWVAEDEDEDSGAGPEVKTMPKEKLADFLGKDMAQKIIDETVAPLTPEQVKRLNELNPDTLTLPPAEAKELGDLHRQRQAAFVGVKYTGNDLKVGGKGMRGFYDKMLPEFVAKYVKKWGAKVERGTLGGNRETKEMRNGVERTVVYHTDTAPVHLVNITPAMRKDVMAGQPQFSPKVKISKPGKDVADKNVHGFAPSLRVRVMNPPEFSLNSKGEPQTLLTQTTTNGNAGKQLENLDVVLSKFKNPTKSAEAWSEMMAYALGGSDVPIPPYAFIADINGAEAGNKVSALSAGQIEDATHGFEQAAKFRAAYESGKLTPVTTGKLFLWSFLSRGVSPYVQEGLFIDAFDGAAPWIQRAADGNFTKDDMPEYEAWARSAAPKGSGQPGAGATHNLNAFGNNFLVNMALKDETGKTRMQHLHEMFSDPNMTGQQIRREFMRFGEGVGIDNKVVSFTLLVAGHSDVMVIDRVQTRQLWDDGRFKDINIYDGQKDAEGKVITGTPLANLTYGVRGLLAYEAIERGLQAKIGAIYAAAGRPQDASVGRYHWESWVAYSQQEASHGTLGAILDDALGGQGRNASAIADVTAKQGEYGAYEYGARYGRGADNQPFFRYDTPTGGRYEFSVPSFRAFLEEIKKPANGVVPSKFKVTASGNEAWYERAEVNRERLDDVARRFADRNREGALPRALPGQDAAGGSVVAGAGTQPNAAGQFSPKLDTTRQLRSDRAGDAGQSRSYTREGGRDGGQPRLLKSLGVSYDAEWVAGDILRKSYEEDGTNIPARIVELAPTESNARRFVDLITASKKDNKHGASVAVYEAEDYKGFRLLLADNGKSGVAVKPDGDIVSVFSSDKSGSAMMEVAVAAGGVKLDAFNTILPKFYHRFGFVEAGRTAWNDDYAPEGWDKELYKDFNGGEPDVVLMVLDPEEMGADLQQAPVFPSWDEAAEAQAKLLDRLHPSAPEGATINLRLDRLDGGQSFSMDEARAVVEDTGAKVVAERARRVHGKMGAPGVVMQLDRPLTPEEANAVSERLKQKAIAQFANGVGEVYGPNAASWGAFDPSKFHMIESGPSLSPRVPSWLREKMIRDNPAYAELFKNAPPAPVKVIQNLPPPADKEPRRRASQPIKGTGETRFRATNLEAYSVGEEAPQLERAARLVEKDPERALAIAMLEAKSLTGVHPQFVFIELEKAAMANGDYELQERLSRSPIHELATTQGQQTAAWSNRAKGTPAQAMREIREAREKRNKTRGVDAAAQTENFVKRGISSSRAIAKSTKRPSLNDFIMQLVCKT